jgi:hypothetical protein
MIQDIFGENKGKTDQLQKALDGIIENCMNNNGNVQGQDINGNHGQGNEDNNNHGQGGDNNNNNHGPGRNNNNEE